MTSSNNDTQNSDWALPDAVEIPGAETLLNADGPHVGEVLGLKVIILELHHAGGGEEERRIPLRHEGGARHLYMIARRKEIDVGAADLMGRSDSAVTHPLA